tara:strand:+ start:61 stop:168 length:108 start_codon:yes stop_codon:yes gene_type:complete
MQEVRTGRAEDESRVKGEKVDVSSEERTFLKRKKN